MDELDNIAKAYYKTNPDLKNLAKDFIVHMKRECEHTIDQQRFIMFMRRKGHHRMATRDFFNELLTDVANGILHTQELRTLFYIINSGRPFCDNCNSFIPSTYFMCLGCSNSANGISFNICLTCYIAKQGCHGTHDLSQFVDNYTFLDACNRYISTDEVQPTYPNDSSTSSDIVEGPIMTHHSQIFQYSQASPTWIENFHYHPPPDVVAAPDDNAVVLHVPPLKVDLGTLMKAIPAVAAAAYERCSIL